MGVEELLQVSDQTGCFSNFFCNSSSTPPPPALICIYQGNATCIVDYPMSRIPLAWLPKHSQCFWFKGDVGRLPQIHHILTSEVYCQEEEKHSFRYAKLICTKISAEELTFNFLYLPALFLTINLGECQRWVTMVDSVQALQDPVAVTQKLQTEQTEEILFSPLQTGHSSTDLLRNTPEDTQKAVSVK